MSDPKKTVKFTKDQTDKLLDELMFKLRDPKETFMPEPRYKAVLSLISMMAGALSVWPDGEERPTGFFLTEAEAEIAKEILT